MVRVCGLPSSRDFSLKEGAKYARPPWQLRVKVESGVAKQSEVGREEFDPEVKLCP